MEVFHLLWSLCSKALLIALFLLVVALLVYCLYIKYIHLKYDHIPGPARDSFFMGHSATLKRITESDGIVHDKLLEWSETYGSAYRLNILHYVLVLVTCPEATKEILMSPKYPKGKFIYGRLYDLFGQRFLGTGLVTAQNHEVWYKQRRIMDPAFNSLYLKGLLGTFNDRVDQLMEMLAADADNDMEVNMLHYFNSVTLDVIAKVAFDVDLDLLKTDSPFAKAIDTCLKGLVYWTRDFFFEFIPKNRGFIREVREACRLLRTTGTHWIHNRRTAMQNREDIPKDILTQIIKTAATEETMTAEDEEFMLDNFVTFFVAGQETTANQLAFCVMELGRHPEILEKVRNEVDDVIGMKQDVSDDDLGKLTYLSQVLKETLRLYSTAPGTSRLIVEDMVIDGVQIPEGTYCMINSYVTGRMDKFFKDPLKFDPDRFHPDAPKPYYCYFPFSLGPRSCLGKNFAEMEAKVVMAKLLQRFEFTLIPGQTFDVQDTGTLSPKSGVVCTIKHRK
ncbi:cholesterol 24-hydroxylase [Nematolebias whitei]|uniref:cholesterol 24-hydroxylase n=1 Tax=Nematolebias whitei TaxID=451745 RepID=UPI00189B1A57|nr:cholesterol 24-hydroxylase [Nematolebias whitei]